MTGWQGFRQCVGCGYDIATGDGDRACSWGDCPYLPEALDVFCPQCRFNFFTMQGNSLCGRPGLCDNAADARAHVETVRAWAELQTGSESTS